MSTAIAHTVNAYASELGKDAKTINAGLKRADLFYKPNDLIPLRHIIIALYGEDYAAKVAGMLLDNQRKEREEREANRELCQWEEVVKWLNEKVLGPASTAMDAAPAEIDREWVEKVLKPAILAKLDSPQ